MKHIYIFNTENLSIDYGISTYLRELQNCLKENNDISLTIVTLLSHKEECSFKIVGSTRFIDIPFPRLPNCRTFETRDLTGYSITVCCFLECYLNNEEKNIFHLNYTQQVHLIPYLRKISPTAKIIFTIHYMRWISALDHNISYFRAIVRNSHINTNNSVEGLVINDFLKLKQICNEVDRIICLSSYTYELLVSDYEVSKAKIFIMANGIKDERQKLSVDERIKAKIQMGLDPKTKIVLFVGRLQKSKGVHLLIQAFDKLKTDFPNTHLIVAGAGNYDEILSERRSVYTNVTFTGKIEKTGLYRLYQIADIGVQPSLNEQCSFVAIEMMMHGIPIIGFDSTGISDMIVSGLNGYKILIDRKEDGTLEESRLIDKLLVQIQEIVKKEKVSKHLRKGSRSVFEKLYKIDKMKRDLLKVYFFEEKYRQHDA